MDEKTLNKISLIIILTGFILFLIFYNEEFPESSVSQLIKNPDDKGKVFGRVDYVIQSETNTTFIFISDQKIKVFYPNKIELKKNDFVWVYAQITTYKNEIELFAQKVIKE